jgi:hypothetical protein
MAESALHLEFEPTPDVPAVELLAGEEFFAVLHRAGDASQPDLSPFDRRQHNVNNVDLSQPFQRFGRRVL